MQRIRYQAVSIELALNDRSDHSRRFGLHNMDWPDYLRDQAAKFGQLAKRIDDPFIKNEMLELASVCEEVANNIEDRLTGG